MPAVRIADQRVWVGDEARALLSGEVHYWRLSPDRWAAILGRVRELGLNIVSSYVPWYYHEVAPQQYDFRGTTEPQRDLVRFLDQVAEQGFWMLFRPGPYIYSEWVNSGIPDRLAHYHRLHPDFLSAARDYMAAVVEVARPYFATHGGPIVLFQADNEPDAWVAFYEQQLGVVGAPGPFQEYLRQRYSGDIAALNAAWETQLDDFDQARAVTRPLLEERGYRSRFLDFRRFQYAYSTEIARWTADTYRDLGVDVPIYLNTYAWLAVQNWREIEAVTALAGPDYYPSNEFRRLPHEHQEFLQHLRYTRSYSALPFIPEFESGIWHGWHYENQVLTARHYRLACLSALLAGIVGWNWYMLVNRDNWYFSPINEWGRVRPELFEVFQQIVALFREIDPPALVKQTHTALVLDVLDRPGSHNDVNDPVVSALYQAGVDYDCWDVETGRIARPLLFYDGHRWLSRAAQERLLAAVEQGGHLIFFQQLPTQDEALRPLNALGLRLPDGVVDGGSAILALGDETATFKTGPFFSYQQVPGEPIHLTRGFESDYFAEEVKLHLEAVAGTTFTVGYHEPRGRGSITVLGVAPDPAVVLAVHRWLKIPVPARARLAGISTALFRQGEEYVVIAVNNSDSDHDAVIDLDGGLFAAQAYAVRDLLSGERWEADLRRTGQITLRLPAKSGTAARLTPR